LGRSKNLWITLVVLSFLLVSFFAVRDVKTADDDGIISYTVNPKKANIQLYWKNDKGENISSIENLKEYLKTQKKVLLFAMNGGMYKKEKSPQGLFIQNGVTKAEIDTTTGNGNFYLKPNGVFFLRQDHTAGISLTNQICQESTIKYATQSGPMLVVNGTIHPAFKTNSTNLNIRNGVGILPNHHVVFAMSKKEINFYDFATYFKKLGCKEALYLDGFVSRMYLPEKKWMQTDGNFGVIIGVSN
jgi:uncharacterized protein YigE (DUF2233 family)